MYEKLLLFTKKKLTINMLTLIRKTNAAGESRFRNAGRLRKDLFAAVPRAWTARSFRPMVQEHGRRHHLVRQQVIPALN